MGSIFRHHYAAIPGFSPDESAAFIHIYPLKWLTHPQLIHYRSPHGCAIILKGKGSESEVRGIVGQSSGYLPS